MGCEAILAIDPGTEKIGLAVLDSNRHILAKQVLPLSAAKETILAMVNRYGIKTAVLGDRTGADNLIKEIRQAFPSLIISLVNEYRSTEEGRKRYWIDNRPRGWRRFWPTTLMSPPVPYDDYAAIVLGERYLDSLKK
jgi:hypothetical protein